jgi:hypothetical protein
VTRLVILAVALALGAIRVAGHTSPAFQAAAHLFVGVLFGAWFMGRERWNAWLLYLALALSVLELACFLLGVGK